MLKLHFVSLSRRIKKSVNEGDKYSKEIIDLIAEMKSDDYSINWFVVQVESSTEAKVLNKGETMFPDFIKNFNEDSQCLIGICKVKSTNVKTKDIKNEYIKIEWIGINTIEEDKKNYNLYIESHKYVFNFFIFLTILDLQ